LWPLARRASQWRSGSDVAIYRDQLEEIERDRAAGLIEDNEAVSAQVEVSRRLIAAADAQTASPTNVPSATWRRRAVAIVALVLLPFGAATLYLALGSPSLPDRPLAPRLAAAAVRARRNALRLNGSSAEREAGFGEALVFAANGIVTAEAKAAFERAVALDANGVQARYFLGLAAEQDGDRTQAAATWRALIEAAPPDAPWIDLLRRALARVDRAAVPEDPSAASELAPEQRQAMIQGMVERLSERLHRDGGDVEGWLRLVRSYMVLGQPDKARAAVVDARRALTGDTGKLRRLDDLLKGLGLEG
jgi:cytochrome c-type biogenesis protein CcmH